MRHASRMFVVALVAATASPWLAGNALATNNSYGRKPLVADGVDVATTIDPNLVNPWGIAFNPFGFVWVSDNGTGVSTLYDGQGTPSPAGTPLIVSIPDGKPTGIVFNGSSSHFTQMKNGAPVASPFIFATENGVVAAWAPAINPTQAQEVFRSKRNAIYKGLAIAGTGQGLFLYVTDFHNNHIDVLDANFKPHKLIGDFLDANLPAGYAPFNIANISGNLYVTYAKQDDDAEDDVAGPGFGFIDVFAPNGTFVRRLVSHGALNAPWGMALAPANFGAFGGRLLVGNFGDGSINAFDLATGEQVGKLKRPDGQPLRIEGLWGLAFGNGLQGQPTKSLYFTAGPDNETRGLYGRINFVPPTSAAVGDDAVDASEGQ